MKLLLKHFCNISDIIFSMKYAHLVQIASYLSNFTKINQAKRINDMAILIEFNGEKIIFDLNKSNSAIYKDDEQKEAKIYQAPFDNVLKKRFNASHIKSVECLKAYQWQEHWA